ncbi:hypothetical protein D210916BOD24_01230 [Alteromonas sp. D210916BOD_24]|uniref:hypothetical protein n=1 Tax=Alteromonas sp. D210916BOD_24 TaxID=3157618 RepID=UPI00399C8047
MKTILTLFISIVHLLLLTSHAFASDSLTAQCLDPMDKTLSFESSAKVVKSIETKQNKLSICEKARKMALSLNQVETLREIDSAIRQLREVTKVELRYLPYKLEEEKASMTFSEFTQITSSVDAMPKDALSESSDTPIQPIDFLLPSFEANSLTYQFYTGFEYTNVQDMFNDNTLRFGLQTYFKPGESLLDLKNAVSDMRADKFTHHEGFTCNGSTYSCGRWFKNIPHFFLNVALTGAGETAAGLEESESGTSEEEPADDPNENDGLSPSNHNLRDSDLTAVEFDLAIYYPFYLGSRGDPLSKHYQEISFGLISTYGARKVDDIDNFQQRYYGGLRFAFNEETFLDLMYGKSEPLKGRRLQLRGQLPVYTLGEGRVFLGAIANIEVARGKRNDEGELVSQPDSIQVYLTWQTTFDQLFRKGAKE